MLYASLKHVFIACCVQEMTIPVQTKEMVAVQRGGFNDNFWSSSNADSWSHLCNNSSMFSTMKSGSDEQVLQVPNLIISSPTTTKSCAEAAEQKLVLDLAMYLAIDCNVRSKAAVMRITAFLPDRICMGCAYNSQICSIVQEKRAVCCKAGMVVCGNCKHKQHTLQDWVAAGCPCRHLA